MIQLFLLLFPKRYRKRKDVKKENNPDFYFIFTRRRRWCGSARWTHDSGRPRGWKNTFGCANGQCVCVNVTSVKKTGANFLSRSEHVFFFVFLHSFVPFFSFFYSRRVPADSNIQILSTRPADWISKTKSRNSVNWFTIGPRCTCTLAHPNTQKMSLVYYIFFERSSNPAALDRVHRGHLTQRICI